MIELHVGRSFGNVGGALEKDCPCPKAPCGLILMMDADPDCPEHAPTANKTMRSIHNPEICPGGTS